MAKQANFVQPFDSSSRHASYRLGLIDPRSLAPMLVEPGDAPAFKLLVPGPDVLSPSLLAEPLFRHAAIDGYYAYDLDGEMDGYGFAPVRVVNWVWRNFASEARFEVDRAWTVGYILGALSSLAEYDRALALVGIAHFSFLLALVPSLPMPELTRVVGDADFSHNQVVRAFRDRVAAMKAAQGLNVWDASRLVLADGHAVEVPYADGSLSNTMESGEKEEVA